MNPARMKRYTPLGLDPRRETRLLMGGLAAAGAYSLGFLIRLFQARRQLFRWREGELRLEPGLMMPNIGDLLVGSFYGFAVLGLCMLALAVWHYAYHYQGSRSIYTMRRLPKRSELWRRCLALPLAGILACIPAILLFKLFFYACYLAATPKICLAPGQWYSLWSVFL